MTWYRGWGLPRIRPAHPPSRTTFGIVVRFVVRVDERNEVASSIEWPSKWGGLIDPKKVIYESKFDRSSIDKWEG